MDEEDVTLYVNCRNRYSAEAFYKLIECFLVVLNKKYKGDENFRVIEVQHSNNYIFYVRFIDQEKCNMNFVNQKYIISDQEVLDYIKIAEKDEDVYKYIFGNFIKGIG